MASFERYTAWKVSKYGVFFGPNAGKYGPAKTPYLGHFSRIGNTRERKFLKLIKKSGIWHLKNSHLNYFAIWDIISNWYKLLTVLNIFKVNESRCIILFVVSGSFKKHCLIDYVNNPLFSIFFSIGFEVNK